jgi:hypothetical protein
VCLFWVLGGGGNVEGDSDTRLLANNIILNDFVDYLYGICSLQKGFGYWLCEFALAGRMIL